MRDVAIIFLAASLLAACAGTPPAGTPGPSVADVNTGSHISGVTTNAQTSTDTHYFNKNNTNGSGGS